jgi:hypothetical protein
VNLYLSRVGDNTPPAGPTEGRDFLNIFSEAPQAANARDHS